MPRQEAVEYGVAGRTALATPVREAVKECPKEVSSDRAEVLALMRNRRGSDVGFGYGDYFGRHGRTES